LGKTIAPRKYYKKKKNNPPHNKAAKIELMICFERNKIMLIYKGVLTFTSISVHILSLFSAAKN